MASKPAPTAEYDRRPQETDPSWQGFTTFRDMPERTLAKVATELGKSVQLIERWSQRHDWVRRSGLWDADQDRAKTRGILSGIEDMEHRHSQIGKLMQQKGLEAIRSMNPEDFTPTQAEQWISEGIAIERRAAGKATEIFQEEVVDRSTIPATLSKEDQARVVEMARAIKKGRLQAVPEIDEAG